MLSLALKLLHCASSKLGALLPVQADLQPLYVALAKLGLAELPLLPEPSKTTFAPVAADLQYVSGWQQH
jgi:hypothetical protein